MNAPSGVELRLTVLAAAVAAALGGPARADERDDEIARLAKPASSVSAGVGRVSTDNTRFGQYTGMTEKGLYLLLDADINRRDDATGHWTTLQGRNLGLESRSLRFGQTRQGDWGYFIEFNQIPRYSPYTPFTRLAGEDSGSQVVNGLAAARELELKTERKRLDLGFDKALGRNFDVQVRFRNEDKSGRRLFGRSGSDFLVDPIDYQTQIVEATAGYTAERLQLSGGYYGTNFNNGKTRLDVTGGTGGAFTPIGLPPSNQSHGVHLAGGYGFTPTMRGTFKLGYTHQTQTDRFMDVSTTGRTDLGGTVNTSLMQFGLTARPVRGLSLLANLRREDRRDKTPVVDYFNITTTTTSTGENEPRSVRTTAGKLEGTYQLPAAFRVTAGVDYEEKQRNTSSVRVVSFRDTTEEKSLRLELRRALSDTLNGSLGLVASDRTGSPWQTTVLTTGANGSNLLHPLHLADRKRDKLRATLGWMPADRLDVQFVGETSEDEYSGRTLGLRDGAARFLSLDAALRFTDNWQATAWISRDDTRADMRSCSAAAGTNTGNISACPNTAASPIWDARMKNVGDAFGLGLKGKPLAVLELAGELQFAKDHGEFSQAPMPPGVTRVPDSNFNRRTLRVSGDYALRKNAGLRLQYVHDRFDTDDWTWQTWTYSDGTRVLPNANQRVNFVGLSGYYQF